jgi:hypothetical protein
VLARGSLGSLIFAATFLLMALSRRLEYAIMSKNGPRSHVEYAQYIRVRSLFYSATALTFT